MRLAADVAGRAALLALLVVAARTLTGLDFGRYAYALAVGLIAAHLATGGLQVTLLRRLSISRETDDDREALGDALRARTALGILLGAGAAALAGVAGQSPSDGLALAAIAVSPIVAAHGELWLQTARAAGRLQAEALAGLLGRAAIAVGGTVALVIGGGLAGLAVAYVFGSVLTLIVSRAIARSVLEPGRRRSWAGAWASYHASIPLAVAGIASLLMFRIDVLLLEWLRGADAVGLYTAAYRPFEAALLVSVAVMAGAFPRLARLASEPHAFAAFALRVCGVLVVLAAALAVVGWWLGPPLLELAFGQNYAPAGDIVRILVLALLPIYVNALLTHALVAVGRAWAVAAAMAAGLVANIGLNLALIPSLGGVGAAVATVAAESVLFGVSLAALVPPMLGARARPPRPG